MCVGVGFLLRKQGLSKRPKNEGRRVMIVLSTNIVGDVFSSPFFFSSPSKCMLFDKEK